MNFFSYKSILNDIYLINQNAGMRLGLENIQRLADAFGNPEQSYPAICIAGTNGKGSVTTKIASTLTLSGYKVGLYTSPHISSFRERIRINGKEISEEEVAELLQRILQVSRERRIEATFFEYVTMLAFLFFAQEKVDVCVLETGLGGRLDATNISRSILSVITSISFDHMALLGHTIEAITKEKAGIIKRHVPVVIGPNVPSEYIVPVAQAFSSQLFKVEMDAKDVEQENCAVAKKAIEVISNSFTVSEASLEQGLKALPPCRFETVEAKQLIKRFGNQIPKATILDVGHNPDAMVKLRLRIQNSYGNVPVYVVYGASKDKDISSCLEEIMKCASAVYFVQAEHPRAQTVNELEAIAKEWASQVVLHLCKTVEEGVEKAFSAAAKEGEGEGKGALLVICGSFFIMPQTRRYLGFDEPSDGLNLNEQGTVEGLNYAIR